MLNIYQSCWVISLSMNPGWDMDRIPLGSRDVMMLLWQRFLKVRLRIDQATGRCWRNSGPRERVRNISKATLTPLYICKLASEIGLVRSFEASL